VAALDGIFALPITGRKLLDTQVRFDLDSLWHTFIIPQDLV
jgi:hypothetical protein